MDGSRFHLRRTLFHKYFAVLFLAVALPLVVNGITEAWFGYREQRAILSALLRAETVAAAEKIRGFLDGIKEQLGWTVQQAWTEETQEQHQFDALRVLRQAPAIVDITLIDGAGSERLYVSRVGLNRNRSGVDHSTDPAVSGARSAHVWYGPVTYYRESEPFMTISVSGNRPAVGYAVAQINLKLIWDVVSAIHVGRSGQAFVLDPLGRLIAHPDISKVLRGARNEAPLAMRRVRDQIIAAGGAVVTVDNQNEVLVADMTEIVGANWLLFVEQPLSEAFRPIYAALWRTCRELLVGVGFAGALAYWLAQRMVGPIRLLEEGTQLIAAGQFDHRIKIATGDELEHLAAEFNRMAAELSLSLERSQRIARLKRFLSPQIAELVEKDDESILTGRRAEVVAVFCDLRGFTPFCARAEPEDIIRLQHEYYDALGSVIATHEATLMQFSGDGLMVLVNAPVPRADPALDAVVMAAHMQQVVQRLIVGWRSRGYDIGFGVGLAMGWATVGQIGYESRAEYVASGNVVNLAARLCAAAEDRQILTDSRVAEGVCSRLELASLGTRTLKGYDEKVPVYTVKNWQETTLEQLSVGPRRLI